MKITALVGNGSSVAYNSDLAIGSLTAGIVAEFSALAGSEAADALAAFAAQVTGTEREDFEGLLGPLDRITQALPLLGGTAEPFSTVDWIAQPLQQAADALRRLHRLGLGTALGLIAARAHGQGEEALAAGVGALTAQLRATADGALLTIATLNYDGLLLATLPENDVADLATGQGAGPVNLLGTELPSWPIRSEPDLPDNRSIHLLNLHGSLGWLQSSSGELRKFRIDDLRAINYWERLAHENVQAEPVVVLTDRKDEIIGTAPFALGYAVFGDRLISSTHWCVAGYSFLDAPVNRLLTDAVRVRRSLGLADPKLLVLGRGDTADLETHVTDVLGDATPTLFLDGSGLPDSVDGTAWADWAEPQKAILIGEPIPLPRSRGEQRLTTDRISMGVTPHALGDPGELVGWVDRVACARMR